MFFTVLLVRFDITPRDLRKCATKLENLKRTSRLSKLIGAAERETLADIGKDLDRAVQRLKVCRQGPTLLFSLTTIRRLR
jgi:hypothetical protein